MSTRLTCYRGQDTAPEMIPRRPGRWLVDLTEDRFAYMCKKPAGTAPPAQSLARPIQES